jgi:hypothetical protein
MTKEEAEGAGAHGNQAPGRMLQGMVPANGFQLMDFCRKAAKGVCSERRAGLVRPQGIGERIGQAQCRQPKSNGRRMKGNDAGR